MSILCYSLWFFAPRVILADSFGLSLERGFSRITDNGSVKPIPGEYADFPEITSRGQCAAMCHSQACRGFTWDNGGEPQCRLQDYMIEEDLEADTGKESYLAEDIECFAQSDCTMPYGPICLKNQCILECQDFHQELVDNNCTLSFETRYHKDTIEIIPWLEVLVSPLDGITLDSECVPEDRCGFVLGFEDPQSRFRNFWPESYNFWPPQQVVVTYEGEKQLVVKHVKTAYLSREVLYEASVPVTREPPIITIEVKFSQSGDRTVQINQQTSDEVDAPLDPAGDPIILSSSMSEDKFYVSFVHEAFQQYRTTSGPVWLKEVVTDNQNSYPLECSSDLMLVKLHRNGYSDFGEVQTCLDLPSYELELTTIRYWYQLFGPGNNQHIKLSVQMQEKKSPTTDLDFWLTSKYQVSQFHDPREELKSVQSYIRVNIDRAGKKVSLRERWLCQKLPDRNCNSDEITLEAERISQNIFDGREHSIEIEAKYVDGSDDEQDCKKYYLWKDKKLSGYEYTFRVTIDKEEILSYDHWMFTRCYKYKEGQEHASVDHGTIGKWDAVGVAGEGFKIIFTEAVPVVAAG